MREGAGNCLKYFKGIGAEKREGEEKILKMEVGRWVKGLVP